MYFPVITRLSNLSFFLSHRQGTMLLSSIPGHYCLTIPSELNNQKLMSG